MKQIISKNGKVLCSTTVPYPKEVIKQMKKIRIQGTGGAQQMTNIVFLNNGSRKQELYTTSDIIAVHTKHSYRSIQRIIENHIEQLERFGQVRFEITSVKYSRGTNEKKIYHLNEPQATLLITFMRNNEVVTEFKTELVRQFFLMRAELIKRQQLRTELKPIRRELTDAIKDRTDLNRWAYKSFTDLAYKQVTGKTAAAIKKERGAALNSVAVSFLSASELEALQVVSNQIAVLIDLGMDYEQIKTAIKKDRESLRKSLSQPINKHPQGADSLYTFCLDLSNNWR